MQMTGNTILITGGTSGIGRALAERFHQRGNQVIIAGRRQMLIDEITAANPGLRGLRVDLDDTAGVDRFAGQVQEQFPTLNVVINNAGISRPEDLTAQAFGLSVTRSILQTNVLSVIQLTTALLPTLKKQPGSTIITTSSGLAFMPNVHFPAYSASKAFLHSWLQSLRFQLRKVPIEVLELVAPYVQTELTGKRQVTDPNAMPLAEYADEVLHMLGAKVPANGEIVSHRSNAVRRAEKNGEYETMFAARNER